MVRNDENWTADTRLIVHACNHWQLYKFDNPYSEKGKKQIELLKSELCLDCQLKAKEVLVRRRKSLSKIKKRDGTQIYVIPPRIYRDRHGNIEFIDYQQQQVPSPISFSPRKDYKGIEITHPCGCTHKYWLRKDTFDATKNWLLKDDCFLCRAEDSFNPYKMD